MIRVLVADDSRAFRAILRTILGRSPEIEVVGEAQDGHEAVSQVLALRPDVVTMDVRMPNKDGLEALEEIMRRRPTPVVVVSSEAGTPEKQEVSFRALELGAVEVLAKPRADVRGRFEKEAEEIRMAVRAVAGLKLVTRHKRNPRAAATAAAAATLSPPPPGVAQGLERTTTGSWALKPAPTTPLQPLAASAPRVLGIAASTGGPAALAKILRDLPAGFPIPILVVQHIAEGFEGGLVHWLGGETPLHVKLAENGEPLRGGTMYVAPSGSHLGASNGTVLLLDGEPVRGFRPSGTVLFRNLAQEYGRSAAGLVLSGMGDDGAEGLKLLRDRGAWTGAQGPQSSVVYGMPRVAAEKGAVIATMELDEIAPALVKLSRGMGIA
ncbi:MAG TPA: chemotaxis-specific protein-glutamate methyltransferase CheB [Anaeromyxobacter sp.]|nr:chemotaxis-specific protein-glutamate methyltransferase CheB [Anaeromyxobacter sp.]